MHLKIRMNANDNRSLFFNLSVFALIGTSSIVLGWLQGWLIAVEILVAMGVTYFICIAFGSSNQKITSNRVIMVAQRAAPQLTGTSSDLTDYSDSIAQASQTQ